MFNITELTCRVCLQEQQVLINVFEELEDLQTTLCRLLHTCGDLQVEADDVYPKYLCEECTGELLIAAKFRDKCIKSKQTLISAQHTLDQINDENDEMFNDIIEVSSEAGTKCISEENEVYSISTADLELIENNALQSHQSDNDTEAPITYSTNEAIESITEGNINHSAQNDYLDDTLVEEEEEPSVDDVSLIDYTSELVETSDYEVGIEVSDCALSETTPLRQKKQKAYKCDICGAAFVQAINLQKHMQKSHASVQCYTCTVCDHWFSIEIELIKHEKYCKEASLDEEDTKDDKKKRKPMSNGSVESHRKCVYCERDFPTPFALRMHLRTHTGERPYPCQYCEKAFKTQSSLKVHIKRHIGQADITCTVCEKSFYEQGALDVHMRSHTGERPYVCAVCQKSFTRVYLLQLHTRIHTGEKPYTCSYCDRSFRQRTDLKCHLSTHTGVKQHNCNLCSKGYVKRASLVQHMQSHHAIHMDNNEAENDESTQNMYVVEEIENIVNFDDIIETEEVG